MKWVVLIAVTALASSASAATLSVVSDKVTYIAGETITLSINGDSQGASAFAIFGRLRFDGSLLDNVSRSQKLIGSGWVKGGLGEGDTNAPGPATAFAEAFNQINIDGGLQTATNPISTVILVWTGPPGVVNVTWDTTSPGFELDFFGLTSAPGASFSIVPEPRPWHCSRSGCSR
jgi:hypothetical protein